MCESIVLDLVSFTHKVYPAIWCGARMNGSFTHMFHTEGGNNQSRDTSSHNFTTLYRVNSRAEDVKTFNAKYYAFGITTDGNLICGDAHVFQNNNVSYLKNLRVVNPSNGTVLKNLYKGTLVDISEGALANPYGKSYNWHLNSSQTMLVRQRRSDYQTTVFPFNGKPSYELAIKKLISDVTDTVIKTSYSTSSPASTRLIWHSTKSGAVVLDTTFTGKSSWRATQVQNTTYYVFETPGSVTAFNLQSGKLKAGKIYPLIMDGTEISPLQGYYLAVSIKASRVALMPARRASGTGNDGYIWDLASGRLLHKIVDFFKPGATEPAPLEVVKSMPKADPCQPAIDKLTIKPFTFVESINEKGRIYEIKGYDCATEKYKVEYNLAMQSGIQRLKTEFALFNMNNYRSISAETCNVCKGSGSNYNTVGYNTTEVDNYNARAPGAKVITRKSGTIDRVELCKKCLGQGVVKY